MQTKPSKTLKKKKTKKASTFMPKPNPHLTNPTLQKPKYTKFTTTKVPESVPTSFISTMADQ